MPTTKSPRDKYIGTGGRQCAHPAPNGTVVNRRYRAPKGSLGNTRPNGVGDLGSSQLVLGPALVGRSGWVVAVLGAATAVDNRQPRHDVSPGLAVGCDAISTGATLRSVERHRCDCGLLAGQRRLPLDRRRAVAS